MCNESPVSAYFSHQHIIITLPFYAKKRNELSSLGPLNFPPNSVIPSYYSVHLYSPLYFSLHKLTTATRHKSYIIIMAQHLQITFININPAQSKHLY